MSKKMWLSWCITVALMSTIHGNAPVNHLAPSRVQFLTMESGPGMESEYRVFISNGPTQGILVDVDTWDACFINEWYPCKGDDDGI